MEKKEFWFISLHWFMKKKYFSLKLFYKPENSTNSVLKIVLKRNTVIHTFQKIKKAFKC